MKKLFLGLCLLLSAGLCFGSLPQKLVFQIEKQCGKLDALKIIRACNAGSKKLSIPQNSVLWNIAIESDFNSHVFLVDEKSQYLRVGALSFTKSACIMIGLFEEKDSWTTMKTKARAFSKLSLLKQMPWILSYYEWQQYYRYKNSKIKLDEIDVRLLTYYPIACSQKKFIGISKKLDPDAYNRNPTYDINKDGIITGYEISLVYERKKKIYS